MAACLRQVILCLSSDPKTNPHWWCIGCCCKPCTSCWQLQPGLKACSHAIHAVNWPVLDQSFVRKYNAKTLHMNIFKPDAGRFFLTETGSLKAVLSTHCCDCIFLTETFRLCFCSCTRPGELVVSLGTSATLFGVSGQPIIDPTCAVCPFCDATGAWLPLICTLNCTKPAEEVIAAFGISHAEATALAEVEAAGSAGVSFLPYLVGERTPNWPDSTGAIIGLRPGGWASFAGECC